MGRSLYLYAASAAGGILITKEEWDSFLQEYKELVDKYNLCVVSWDGYPAIVPTKGHQDSPYDMDFYFSSMDHYDYVIGMTR